LLEEAKLKLYEQKVKEEDYYNILGVSKTASEADIKQAYKAKALKHHPGTNMLSFTILIC